jgi:hypothetical protein
VEIDRLDEGDARAVSRGNGDRLATGSPAETPDLVVTHETRDRATYYAELRAAVDAEQRTTPEPSDLRQAWAAHEAKWPLTERPVAPPSPDTPGAHCLSFDANTEVGRGCEKIRENGETVITPALRHIEAEDSDRHLIGFEHRLKGAERIKEKVAAELEARPRLTVAQALASVPDAVRFTFCYTKEHYAAGVYADLERLTRRGFKLAKPLKNSWDSDQYKGINTQWRDPQTEQRFEVQFHTRDSFDAKQLSHAAYERIRHPQTSDTELIELKAFQREVCAQTPIPPGAREIDYPMRKERDG